MSYPRAVTVFFLCLQWNGIWFLCQYTKAVFTLQGEELGQALYSVISVPPSKLYLSFWGQLCCLKRAEFGCLHLAVMSTTPCKPIPNRQHSTYHHHSSFCIYLENKVYFSDFANSKTLSKKIKAAEITKVTGVS